MTRLRIIAGIIGGLIVAFLLLLWPGPKGNLACRRIALQDNITGANITGVEDLVLDTSGSRLILSAYDRRHDTPGGIYAVPLTILGPKSQLPIIARRLLPLTGAPSLRPHGIGVSDLGAGNLAIAAIERNRRSGGFSGARVRLYVVNGEGIAPAGTPGDNPLLCNANDIAVEHRGGFLVTIDRSSCSIIGRRIEDILGLRRGRLISVGYSGVRTLYDHIGFANGIAEDPDYIYVAATRSREILIFDRASVASSAPHPPRHIRLADAPDNLNWGDDGMLYIAAHVSLLKFALFRLGLRQDSMSTIYRFDPKAGPSARANVVGRANLQGAVAGATAALAAGGRLVLGSGFDWGLSVCDMAGPGTR